MTNSRGLNRLLRSLSLGDLFVLSSSSMAPAYSLAAVMGLVVAASGLGAPLALIVSTIPITFIAIGFMRLSTKRPSAGAAYSWSLLAFGNRVAWFTAMLIILAYYFGTIATAFPTGAYTLAFALPSLEKSPIAIAVVGCLWIAFSTYFLIIGARPTAKLSAIFLYFEFIALLLIAGIALAHPFTGTPAPGKIPTGFAIGTTGISGLIVGAVLSIWISAGWEISTYSSEESRGAASTPGLGALIGLLGTMAIVWLCMVAFLRVGTVAGFTAHQEDALAYVASRLGGGWAAGLMIVTVLVSSAASIWTTMLSVSRALFAMARDGLMPKALASVHPRYGSPWAAVLAVTVPCAIIMLISGMSSSARDILSTVVSASSIFLGGTFIITGFACTYLHSREEPGKRHPFTGMFLPAIGALWTLAFLIYDVVTQQTALIQGIIIGGIALAIVFAATAGRWAASARPMTE